MYFCFGFQNSSCENIENLADKGSDNELLQHSMWFFIVMLIVQLCISQSIFCNISLNWTSHHNTCALCPPSITTQNAWLPIMWPLRLMEASTDCINRSLFAAPLPCSAVGSGSKTRWFSGGANQSDERRREFVSAVLALNYKRIEQALANYCPGATRSPLSFSIQPAELWGVLQCSNSWNTFISSILIEGKTLRGFVDSFGTLLSSIWRYVTFQGWRKFIVNHQQVQHRV